MHRRHLLALPLLPLTTRPARADGAQAALDRLLQAIGGREAWAAATRLVNRSRQNRLDEPTVVEATIHIDFERPRVRIESLAPGLRLVRVFDGPAHWRLARSGRIEPVPEATLAEDRRWYAAHVYRTLHRLAARDPALKVGPGPDGRLRVLEGDRRLAWFALDARGEPYAFGAHDDEAGTLCGPWLAQPGTALHHPAWTARPDGSWRALLLQLQVNPAFDDALFSRPPPP